MANTIVLVSNNEKWVNYMKIIQPYFVHIKSDSEFITPGILKEACDRSLTQFFYIYTGGIFTDDFDVSFTPDTYSMGFVHVWNGDTRLRLYNKSFISTIANFESRDSIKCYGDDQLFLGYKKNKKNHDKKNRVKYINDNIDRLKKETVPCYDADSIPEDPEEYYYTLKKGYYVEYGDSNETPEKIKRLPIVQKNKMQLAYDRNMYLSFPVQFKDHEHDFVVGYSALSLHKKNNSDVKEHKISNYIYKSNNIKCYANPFDIFFISYNESYAEKNFKTLQSRYPRAKHINGIKGIPQAHIECAKRSNTEHFYVIDADAELLPSFDLEKFIPSSGFNVYVWRAKNPLNGLAYGYGGVKLMSREILKTYDKNKTYLDFSTEIADGKFMAVPNISNITKFHHDEYNTWKGCFRETVKLTTKNLHVPTDKKTSERLNAWLSIKEKDDIHRAANLGAKAGHEYALKHKDDEDALKKINDYDWLKNKYLELMVVDSQSN